MTQLDRVLDYMKTHNGITTLDAFGDLGITRLSSRIFELRQRGLNIKSEQREVKNRYGDKCYVAFYQLVK